MRTGQQATAPPPPPEPPIEPKRAADNEFVAPATHDHENIIISPYTHTSEGSVEFATAMFNMLTTDIVGGPKTHFRPENIPCDEDGGDFQFKTWEDRLENRVTVCEGDTTIECLLDSRDGLAHIGTTKKR